jgi:hypothetical protein
MQIKLLPAALLFLGSYFPLALILVVQDVKPEFWSRHICISSQPWNACQLPQLANPALAVSFFSVTLLCLLFFLHVLGRLPASTEMVIEESKTIPNDLINYVFPYIVSFMGVELSATGKVFGFLLFMVWMFLLSHRSGQILMNPLLLVSGWQLYEVKADIEGNKRTLRALSRAHVFPGQRLRSCLVQGIYVLSKAEANAH